MSIYLNSSPSSYVIQLDAVFDKLKILDSKAYSDLTNAFDRNIKEHPDESLREIMYQKLFREFCVRYFSIYALIHGFPLHQSPEAYGKVIEFLKKFEESTTKSMFALGLPRGCYKSTCFLACFAEYLHIKSRYKYIGRKTQQKALSSLIVHGSLEKAQRNLSVISNDLKNPIIRWLFSSEEYLQLQLDSADEIDFFHSQALGYKPKEPSFSVGSPNKDSTGTHYHYIFIDDLCTRESCRSTEANEKITDYFYRLHSLKDHSVDIMKILYIFTAEYDDTVTAKIAKTGTTDTTEVLILPAEVVEYSENGVRSVKYPFHHISQTQLEYYKETLPSTQYKSQYLLEFYPRERAVDLNADLPIYIKPNREDVLNTTILIDPAVSEKSKTSLMSMLVVQQTVDGNLHVVDGKFTRGTTPTQLLEFITQYVTTYPVDCLIIEAIAAQQYIRKHISEYMAQGKFGGRYFQILEHRHFTKKRDHYLNFLEPLFANSKVHINPTLTELIDEITGKSSYEDAIDCLSFIKERNLSFNDKREEIEYNRKKSAINRMVRNRNTNSFKELTKWC